MATSKSDRLKKDYDARRDSAETFRSALVEQIKKLTSQENISLAVPIESRVKSWSSISGKIDRTNLELDNILQLNDFVGIRLILLFKRDLDKCRNLIEQNLKIVEQEDTASRLGESQFGYQSYHYVIKLPEKWLSIPTFSDFSEFQTEIQVRTVAQHIWAAASHQLQYKQEASVPSTVKRSIYRVSALLEIVDLEFERVLREREEYTKEAKPDTRDETLNVDLIKKILDNHLPIENRVDDEDYSELLQNLSNCEIKKSSELISLIKEQLDRALHEDDKQVLLLKAGASPQVVTSDKWERASIKGVYFSHSGLVRAMLNNKFGPCWKVELSGSANAKSESKGKLTVRPNDKNEDRK